MTSVHVTPLHGHPAPRLRGEALGMTLSDSALEDGAAFLRRHPTIDIHAHPGRFFMNRAGQGTAFEQSYPPPFEAESLQQIRQGGVTGVLCSTVADCCLLESGPDGLGTSRDYAPGEAIADHHRQVELYRRMLREGGVTAALTAADFVAAFQRGAAACMLSVEGGDFIEDRLERLDQAFADGVRSITVIHYHSNQIGDPQTAPPRHDGLSAAGRAVIEKMNRTGLLIDLAHASFQATAQAVEISSRPAVISHSNIASGATQHKRLLALEHARLVTAQGGLIGAIPAGIAQSSFADYVATILRMVDALGIQHVAIGTDMDFTYKSVFPRYEDWPLLPAALLAGGMHESEVALVMGGNFLRVLEQVAVA